METYCVMGAMPYRNHWADIPPEIVDEILGYCEPPSLLALSRVNHQLNSLTLSRYFAEQVTGDIIQLPAELTLENFIGRDGYYGVMRILRAAFWLPRNIQHVNFCFPPVPRYRQYINDLRDLTTFIHRMPRLASLRIDSGYIENDQGVHERPHSDVWNTLLATAVLKECEVLEVKDPGPPYCEEQLFLPPKRSEGLLASNSRFGSKLSHIFGRASILERTITTPNLSSFPSSLNHQFARVVKPSLREVQLDGTCFRNLSFVFHTILMQHTSSITRLSLTNLGIWDTNRLKDVFDHIRFTALESFTFSNGEVLPPIVFLKFLHHHPALTHLDLHVDFRKYHPWSPNKWSLWRRPPTFPNLRHLRIFPDVLQWLVPDFRQCPELCSVALKGDFLSTSVRDFLEDGNPQSVIGSILDDLHALPSMTWPLEVEVELPLDDSRWLSRLHTPTNGKTRPRVKNLRLKGSYPNPCDPTMPSVLVNWLSTFSSLEYLEIESKDHVSAEGLVESLMERCPGFRSLKIIFHPLYPGLPRGWQAWVVQDGRVERKSHYP